MVPHARDAHIDFVRLAAEEPSSLYLEDFLRAGFEAWPRRYQERFPGLTTWGGVGDLKQSLRHIAGAPIDWRVLLASRSLPLLKVGAGCQFRVCRNVMTTDLSWPTYQQAVIERAHRTSNQVTVVAIRDRVFNEGWTAADIARYLAVEYQCYKCDGLFLPAVDHLGIRVPLGIIVETIKAVAEMRFVLVDAAQAICHVSLDDCVVHADFIVAGSHKWMGGYVPTGIALYGIARSREMIDLRFAASLARPCSDSFTRICEQVDGGGLTPNTETVNLLGLFSSAGAASAQRGKTRVGGTLSGAVDRLVDLIPMPSGAWRLQGIAPELRTRIALLRGTKSGSSNVADIVRRAWLGAGCIVSAYDGGFARLSFA